MQLCQIWQPNSNFLHGNLNQWCDFSFAHLFSIIFETFWPSGKNIELAEKFHTSFLYSFVLNMQITLFYFKNDEIQHQGINIFKNSDNYVHSKLTRNEMFELLCIVVLFWILYHPLPQDIAKPGNKESLSDLVTGLLIKEKQYLHTIHLYQILMCHSQGQNQELKDLRSPPFCLISRHWSNWCFVTNSWTKSRQIGW